MMEPGTLREFFGWCTVVNFGVLLLSGAAILVAGRKIAALHARMFGMSEAEVKRVYFQYLSAYKVVALVFSFAPWLALKIMG